MALFLNKEDILGTPPVQIGGVSQATSPGMNLGSGDILDKGTRLLEQINGILTQANNLRNNPMVQGFKPTPGVPGPHGGTLQANSPDVVAKFGVDAPPPPLPATIQPIAKTPGTIDILKPAAPALNEDAVKSLIAEVIGELEKNENVKGVTMAQAVAAYKLMPGQKEQLEQAAIKKIGEWLPRLIK